MPPQSSAPDFIPDTTSSDFIPDPAMADLHAKAGFTTTGGTPPAPPTFTSRLAESFGIPTSMEELKGAFQKPSIGQIAERSLTGPVSPFIESTMNAAKQFNPSEPMANEVPKAILTGPLAPVGGQAVENFAEDVGKRQLGPAAGDIMGTIANLLMLKAAKGPKTEGRLAYATGAEAKDVLKSAPDLIKEVQASGRPGDLNEIIGTIDRAKNKLNVEFANALGPNANRTIMPTGPVARLQKLLTTNLPNTAWGKASEKQIKAAIIEFQKPWTLAQLDQERMDANARVHEFEKRGDVDQYAATRKQNRTVAIDKAIADGIRDEIYPMMDQLRGKPAGYFANLKDRIGALMNVESDAKAHRDTLRTRSLQAEGAPLLERLKLRGLVGEEGHPRFYFSNILSPSDPLAAAGRVGQAAFAGPGTSAARAAALVEALRRTAPNHPLLQQQQ